MRLFIQAHLMWTILSILLVVIAFLATMYAFWHKRLMDDGPRKGEAINPRRVRMQNPPDP